MKLREKFRKFIDSFKEFALKNYTPEHLKCELGNSIGEYGFPESQNDEFAQFCANVYSVKIELGRICNNVDIYYLTDPAVKP